MRKRSRIHDCGRIYWAIRNDGYWLEAVEMVKKMAHTHKKKMVSPPVGPICLVKLAVTPGFGLNYRLTIRVEGEDGTTTDYTVDVWRKPAGKPYRITSFTKVDEEGEIEGATSAGSKTSDEKATSSKTAKKNLPPRKGQCSMLLRSSKKSDDHDGGSTQLASGVLQETCTRPRARGFYMLLEQIRSEKPDLTYAEARKEASSMWGKLSEQEKMPFMDKAAKRLKKK